MVNPSDIDECNNIELARDLFWEYCLLYDPGFFSDRPFLEEIADAMQWVYEEYMQDRARSITISLAPRSGKSYITSLFCSWWLGKLPELSVLRNSSTASLYRKLSYDTRKIIKSGIYKTVFPNSKLSAGKTDVRGWNLIASKQVGYFGAGTDGTIIGYGANLAIYDDLIPSIWVAMNNDAVEKILSWKGADHNSRKELNCPEIGIGTRWRKNDPIGDEIAKGNVDREFKVSALIFYNKTDPEYAEYPNGRSFCEKVNKTSFYVKEKRDLDSAIFDAMYQQEPMDLKGLLFPPTELRYYSERNVNVESLSIFRLGCIDPAKGGGDFYAYGVGYLVGTDIYLHDVLFNQDGTDVNEVESVDFTKKNKVNEIKFEGNAAWFLMAKTIRAGINKQKINCSLRIIDNHDNKHTRILAQAGFIRNNFLFREESEWSKQYRAYMKNLTGYLKTGDAKHDDAPDVTAELAKYFREHYKNLW